jgi:hypothetical protein
MPWSRETVARTSLQSAPGLRPLVVGVIAAGRGQAVSNGSGTSGPARLHVYQACGLRSRRWKWIRVLEKTNVGFYDAVSRRRIIVLCFGPRGSCAARKRDRLPDRNAPHNTSLVTPSL